MCEAVLSRGSHGVLALAGDEGYPYAVPISYVYEGGKLYFHCAKSGHKLDAIARCPKASFCVVDQDQVVPQEYTTYFRSVIAFGTIRGPGRRRGEAEGHRGPGGKVRPGGQPGGPGPLHREGLGAPVHAGDGR